MRQLCLTEVESWRSCELTAAEQRLLVDCGLVEIRPTGASIHQYELRASTSVGAARLDGFGTSIDLRIEPKVPIARLLYLMSYSSVHDSWRNELVDLPPALDIASAVAEALARSCTSAFQAGLLQGYITVEEAAMTIRGRIRFGDQLRRHQGLAVPVEITYDDFTIDIAENQILKAALRRMLRVPGINTLTRKRLLIQQRRLIDVTDLVPGQPLPRWTASRLNARYLPALRLAELILRGSSFDAGHGSVRINGFMVSMHKVFEDFVTKSIGDVLVRTYGGQRVLQDNAWNLDTHAQIRLRPDLVWYPDDRCGRPGVVVDAKYKAEKISGFPQSDVYQMLAYCTSLGLAQGHLVYAAGNEDGATYSIPTGARNITIHSHTLNLAQQPTQLESTLATLATRMTSGTP